MRLRRKISPSVILHRVTKLLKQTPEPTRFSWTITAKCNYDCPHCCIPPKWRIDTAETPIPAEECIKAWKRIFAQKGECFIEISGGEPTTYPAFKEIITAISEWHRIGICTNLSFNPNRFLEGINPERVQIYPSFHPTHTKIEPFIRRVLSCWQAGFPRTNPVSVAYPAEFNNLDDYQKTFSQAGIRLEIIPYRGRYRNMDYPEGYTEDEKRFLKININRDARDYQLDKKITRGKLCRAGFSYARIQPEGSVFRCAPEVELGQDKAIGFFYDAGFKLLDRPKPCICDSCPCSNEWPLLIES
jgi:Radical SAM superfamily